MTDTTGFDLTTQKLLCLVVLDDKIGSVLSNKAGEAFFRAFIVEDRVTGHISMNMRYRYTDGDSWSRVVPDAEKQKWSRAERVAYLQEGLEEILRTALNLFAGGASVPKNAVRCFYPPCPDGDPQLTLDYLLEQDLIYVAKVEPIGKIQ
jgi:hypothetical protein